VDRLQEVASPLYGEKEGTIQFAVADLLWRPVGILIRFVAVIHPTRGVILLMSTDRNLTPVEIIRIDGLRFKIERSFKQALHIFGAYAYHFWMAAMTPRRRVSGNQYLHRIPQSYRDAVRRKMAAYHRHMQLGLIAQGLLQILAARLDSRLRGNDSRAAVWHQIVSVLEALTLLLPYLCCLWQPRANWLCLMRPTKVATAQSSRRYWPRNAARTPLARLLSQASCFASPARDPDLGHRSPDCRRENWLCFAGSAGARSRVPPTPRRIILTTFTFQL